MKVVEVIPIAKGVTRPTLSYFTKEDFLPGSFVKIPLRKGSTTGVVASSMDVRKAKSDIRKAGFSLKKLSIVKRSGVLGEEFMQAVIKTAEFYATTEGSVLQSLLPKIILKNPEFLGNPKKVKGENREIKVIGLTEEERFREYRSVVRENFARGKSVFFIVPTREDVARAYNLLSSGIEPYVIPISSTSPKAIKEALSKALLEEHPILFISTPSLIAFDRPDLDTIILERENSRIYRSLTRPYIQFKIFLEYYTRARGILLILGDSVLSLETLMHERTGRYAESTPISWRLKHSSSAEIIDLRAKKEFEVFSPKLKEAIRRTLEEGKSVFIFAVRKGLSATTVCGDCGSLLLCKNCKAPMVLHTSRKTDGNGQGIYLCHHCGAKRSTETRCNTCNSWKLIPLGVGIERVEEECRKLFGKTPIHLMDKDHAPTKARLKAMAKDFERKGGILLGTELALSVLERVSLVAVASLDSLFSIPDYGINERIFYLVTRLREIASEHFLLQTRNAGKDILEFATTGNILDFYRVEMDERSNVSYPPFTLFVKVSTQDSEENIRRKMGSLQELFGKYEPYFYRENRGKTKKPILSMLLRFPREEWPISEVREKLLLLTPDFTVKVDPETIL